MEGDVDSKERHHFSPVRQLAFLEAAQKWQPINFSHVTLFFAEFYFDYKYNFLRYKISSLFLPTNGEQQIVVKKHHRVTSKDSTFSYQAVPLGCCFPPMFITHTRIITFLDNF